MSGNADSRPVVVWLGGYELQFDVQGPGTVVRVRLICGRCGTLWDEGGLHLVLGPDDTLRVNVWNVAPSCLPWARGSRGVVYFLDDGSGGPERVEQRQDELVSV